MTERTIQKKIIDYLESKGYYVVKVIKANKAGVADLTVCKDGKYIAIEVKTDKNKNGVTALQKFHLDLVKKSGGVAFVATSVEDVKEKLHLD